MKVSIVIADAHFLIRQGLMKVLSQEEGFEVIDEVTDESALLKSVQLHRPDVIILDFAQEGHFSEETIQSIQEVSPFSGIMVISGYLKKLSIHHAINRGISTYITKQCESEEILNAVKATAKKEKFFCHRVLEELLNTEYGAEEDKCEPVPLSAREIEIVQYIASGRIAKEIASELHLSTHTIYTHRKNIMRKLDLSSPVELVMYAINKGIVDPKSMEVH